jgi:hypothetical protein
VNLNQIHTPFELIDPITNSRQRRNNQERPRNSQFSQMS